MYQYLKHEDHNNIAVLVISAPQRLNALNSDLLKELDHYISNFDTKKYRCLVVRGDGEKAFVAGADISEMAHLNSEEARQFSHIGATAFRKIETLAVPVVAAIGGYALGGGCELACACDIRICSTNAKFGQPEVGLGIIPGFSGTYRLAKLVGMGMAKDLIFSARTIRAEEALRIGLVNAVYPQEELMSEAMALAEKIAANAPLAVQNAKKCINEEYDLDAEKAIAFETEAFGLNFSTSDQKEGMKAFLKKTKYTYQGK